MSFEDRLYRRVLMASAGITISATDDTGPVHKVQGKVRGTPETIDNLQVVQLYGVASHAPVGSDAFVTFGNGDRSNGVVHATANQAARPRNQKPGEVTIFTDEGDYVQLARGRIVKVVCGTQVEITCPLVTITGDLHVKGAIIAGYGTADQVGVQTHRHTQPSDAHGDGEQPTNPPVPGS